MAYEGKYFADPDHPLELRQLVAKRYPTWAPYIMHADGEGDCQHTECILRRRYHINARIDPLDNDKDLDTSIIDLRCCQPPPSHYPTTYCRRRRRGSQEELKMERKISEPMTSWTRRHGSCGGSQVERQRGITEPMTS